MFDLEKSIADWREQMLAAGIKSPVPLEELENHLREEIRRQMESGLRASDVIEVCTRQIGQPESLKNEFRKIERNIMKRILIISLGTAGVLAGMALIMPAVAQYRHAGAMFNDEPWLFLLGSLLTLAGAGAVLVGTKKRYA
jgi:hypothetical protein